MRSRMGSRGVVSPRGRKEFLEDRTVYVRYRNNIIPAPTNVIPGLVPGPNNSAVLGSGHPRDKRGGKQGPE